MKKMFLFAFVLSSALVVQAQQFDIASQAGSIAQQIYQMSTYLTADQTQKISHHLQAIQTILNGQSNGSNGEYTCVSRDNDGKNPWVIGVRQGVTVARIASLVYRTQSDCQTAISQIRFVGGASLMCASRDNDGRNPYQLVALSGSDATHIDGTVVHDNQSCMDLLQSITYSGGQVVFCASRDNDGVSPFIAIGLNPQTMQITRGNDTFRNISDCRNFLKN